MPQHHGAHKQAPHAQPSHGLSATDKARLCQAVAIGGIPDGSAKAVEKLARSYGTVIDVQHPVPSNIAAFAKIAQDGCTGTTMLVHFATGKEAFEAVWTLHSHNMSPSPKASKQKLLWARQVNGEGANVRCRAFSSLRLYKAKPAADRRATAGLCCKHVGLPSGTTCMVC